MSDYMSSSMANWITQYNVFKSKYAEYISAVEELKKDFTEGTKANVDLLSNQLNGIRNELLGNIESNPKDHGVSPSLKYLTNM